MWEKMARRIGIAIRGKFPFGLKPGGDPKKFLNGVSVYFKQWKGASTQENLDALRGVAETTGSGVAVWELARSAHPQELDPGWQASVADIGILIREKINKKYSKPSQSINEGQKFLTPNKIQSKRLRTGGENCGCTQSFFPSHEPSST